MKRSTRLSARGDFRRAVRRVIVAAMVALLLAPLPGVAATEGTSATLESSRAGGPDAVVATVGTHRVTLGEVDSKVAAQLYDLRKQALDQMIDDYVVQQAARKAGLKPQQYLDQQISSTTPPVTDAEAEKYYNQHKARIDAQMRVHSFAEIRSKLLDAMKRQREQESREQLIEKLRGENQIAVLLPAPRSNVASAGHPSIGAASAPVTIVEFGDFQCPFCRAAEGSLRQVRAKYGDKVKLVYIDFPLGFHSHAMDAARAARCAADQDKFWQFHDALFLDQEHLDPEGLKRTAVKVGLDADKFNSCFSSHEHDAGIHQDIAEGDALGVTGTPTFFINGRQLVGAEPPPRFSEVIDEELAHARAPSSQALSSTNRTAN